MCFYILVGAKLICPDLGLISFNAIKICLYEIHLALALKVGVFVAFFGNTFYTPALKFYEMEQRAKRSDSL